MKRNVPTNFKLSIVIKDQNKDIKVSQTLTEENVVKGK